MKVGPSPALNVFVCSTPSPFSAVVIIFCIPLSTSSLHHLYVSVFLYPYPAGHLTSLYLLLNVSLSLSVSSVWYTLTKTPLLGL